MMETRMTTQTYDVQEAKENFPRLLEKVAAGAEVIIAEEGRPLARISRIGERESPLWRPQGQGENI
jgi:prevent-host-death family protein